MAEADVVDLIVLTSETIHYGSVKYALEKGLFSPSMLLDCLNGKELYRETILAYYILCQHMEPKDQTLGDGKHFLTENPSFSIVAGRTFEVEDDALPDMNNPSILRAASIVNLLRENDLTGRHISTEDVHILYHLRRRTNFHNFENNREVFNDDLLQTDWYELLRYVPSLLPAIEKRLNHLRTNAPLYYSHIVKEYYGVFENALRENLISTVPDDVLSSLLHLIPTAAPEWVSNASSAVRHLYFQLPEVAAYYLGYPIHQAMPGDVGLREALRSLDELGVDAYCKNIIMEYNQLQTAESIKVINEENVIGDKVVEFSPFDIVIYLHSDSVYRFTRAELPQMIESGKNHYTGEFLPFAVITTMQSRVAAAAKLRLPESAPLAQLLHELKLPEKSLGEDDESRYLQEPMAVNITEFVELITHVMNNMTGGEAMQMMAAVSSSSENNGRTSRQIEGTSEDNTNIMHMVSSVMSDLRAGPNTPHHMVSRVSEVILRAGYGPNTNASTINSEHNNPPTRSHTENSMEHDFLLMTSDTTDDEEDTNTMGFLDMLVNAFGQSDF